VNVVVPPGVGGGQVRRRQPPPLYHDWAPLHPHGPRCANLSHEKA
jgi:hypothetical protein